MEKLSDQIRIGLQALEQRNIDEVDFEKCIAWMAGKPKRSFVHWLVNVRGTNPTENGEIEAELPTIHCHTMVQLPEEMSLATQKWVEKDSGSSPFRPPNLATTYEVVRQHAKGGLGVIYIAKDSKLNRHVALKQIREDYRHDSTYEAKFLAEAEITGRLEHPSIVPVYSLGSDAQGQPYYVMRFVHGQELKQCIADFHALRSCHKVGFDSVEFRKLLGHFVDVCFAIDYAHSRGIVHRDLKPANIMIGKYGETLVLDWGLAKSVDVGVKDSQVTESSSFSPIKPIHSADSAQTEAGTFSGTIAYASPEQLEGRVSEIGPGSDVYSLGAILFEILTGSPPIMDRPKSLSDLVAKIRMGNLATAKQQDRRVSLALSMICSRAMKYSIDQRYLAAKDLSDDVERFMADEYVSAFEKREPLLEKLGRCMRRYRSWTIPMAASIVFVTLIAMIGAFMINRARISEQSAKLEAIDSKNAALDRSKLARRVAETMFVGADSLPSLTSLDDIPKQWVDEAIRSFERLSSGENQNPELELDRIRSQIRLGDILSKLTNFPQAAKAYESAKESLSRVQMGVNEIGKADRVSWHMEALSLDARTTYTNYILDPSIPFDLSKAREAFQSCIGPMRLLTKDNPSDDSKLLLVDALLRAFELESISGSLRRSMKYLEECGQLYRGMDAQAEEITQLRILQNLVDVARINGRLGESEKALKAYNAAVQGLQLLQTMASEREARFLEVAIEKGVAEIYRRRGELPESVVAMQKADAILQGLVKQWPSSVRFKESLAQVQTNLGIVFIEQKSIEQANSILAESFRCFCELYDSIPQSHSIRLGLLTNLDATIQVQDHMETGFQLSQNAYKRCRMLFQDWELQPGLAAKPYVVQIATAQGHFAQACSTAGETENARIHFRESKNLFVLLVDEYPDEKDFENALAEVEWKLGVLEKNDENQSEAEQLFQSAESRMQSLIMSDASNHFYPDRLKEIQQSR